MQHRCGYFKLEFLRDHPRRNSVATVAGATTHATHAVAAEYHHSYSNLQYKWQRYCVLGLLYETNVAGQEESGCVLDNKPGGGGHSTFFQVGVCGPDFRSVGLAN